MKSKNETIITPESVTHIDDYTFSKYPGSLTSITIGNGVTSIVERAFCGHTDFTSITIGNSVTSIGQFAFFGCTADIVWGDAPTIATIKQYAFSGYKGTSITIPNSVTSIGGFAFSGCEKLKNITIPDSVTNIGKGAFCRCKKLTTKQNNFKALALERNQLLCRGKRFYIGKRGWAKGPLKLCENGIHFCTNLFDVFNYYGGSYGTDFVIALCDVSEEQDATGAEDSKRCARWVRPTHILTRKELIALLNNPIKGGGK